MFYTYCLQHKYTKYLYYGYSNNLVRRLAEHKKEDEDWTLVYYEAYRSETDARKREKSLKHYGQSRTHLKNRMINSIHK